MPTPKRIVFMVEGEGDCLAVPTLANHVFADLGAWEHAFLDANCMMVGELGGLVKDDGKELKRFLSAALRSRKDLGGVLVLLDGDSHKILGELFCAWTFAHRMATYSREVGAGKLFSTSFVFARQEFESWIIAASDKIAGVPRSDGLPGLDQGVVLPEVDWELQPRDAKKWLSDNMKSGYAPTSDQLPMTRLMAECREVVRTRMRSFRRFENALKQLVEAIRNDVPVVTPTLGPPPTPACQKSARHLR